MESKYTILIIVKKNYNSVKTIIFSNLRMNKVVGLGRKDLRVSGASWIKGIRVDVDHLLKFWVCFRRNSFLSKGEY